MAAKDYYGILGVSPDAEPHEIKRAYRDIARKTHPDVTDNNPITTERFQLAKKAYAVLSDPEQRREYDRLYRPVQSVYDLIFHHPAGQETMSVRLPKGKNQEQVGITTAAAVEVGSGDTSAHTPLPEDDQGMDVDLPKDLTQTPWGRILKKGGHGRNTGERGDHLILIRERRGE